MAEGRNGATEGDLAIVGAGIGGLITAIALQQRGFRPVVFEQAPELGEIGAGLTLSPNATHVLKDLGLLETVRERGTVPVKQFLHHFATGEVLVTTHREETEATYGAPYLFIHRADLHAIMVDAVRDHDPEAVRTGHKLIDAAHEETRIRLAFDNGAEYGFAHVIGADGLRSKLRERLFGQVETRFTGHVAYRFLIPHDRWPRDIPLRESHNFAGPERIFVYYPIRGGAFLNCVGLARAGQWSEEGWAIPAAKADVQAVYAGWHRDVTDLIDAMPDGACFQWGLFDRAPLSQYTRGRVALMGDAAHPMLPFMGMGAASAIEDGLVMARALEAARDAGAEMAEGFRRFEAARLERTHLIQRESAAGADKLQVPDPALFRANAPKLEESLGLFSYNPATVPV